MALPDSAGVVLVCRAVQVVAAQVGVAGRVVFYVAVLVELVNVTVEVSIREAGVAIGIAIMAIKVAVGCGESVCMDSEQLSMSKNPGGEGAANNDNPKCHKGVLTMKAKGM